MACVGGVVWVVRRGGGICASCLAVEGVVPAAVQVVRLAQEGALTGSAWPSWSWKLAGLAVDLEPVNDLCVARKPDRPDLLLCHAFLQAGIRSGRRWSCSKATVAI